MDYKIIDKKLKNMMKDDLEDYVQELEEVILQIHAGYQKKFKKYKNKIRLQAGALEDLKPAS